MKYHNRVMAYTGGAVIAVMMLLVVAQVLCRLLLKTSIEGTLEVVSICMAMAIFLGYSPCEEINHHVKVELVLAVLPERVRRLLNMLVYPLAIGIVMVSAYQVGLEAIDSWKISETLPGADFQVPIYPAKIVCFIGYFAFLIQLIISFAGIFGKAEQRTERK